MRGYADNFENYLAEDESQEHKTSSLGFFLTIKGEKSGKFGPNVLHLDGLSGNLNDNSYPRHLLIHGQTDYMDPDPRKYQLLGRS